MSSFSIQTDPGTKYDHNEDTVDHDDALSLWLVADGMGGHAAGEVASQIARNIFLEKVRNSESHEAAAIAAHQQIVLAAEAQQAQQGMGSTLVAMQIVDSHAGLVWVGDSRAYLWRDNDLSVVTHDHSYVQMLIDQGHLNEESARDHPKRNMVTQVLGLGNPEPETRSLPLQTGDWLVLCSDGLNDELTDGEIAQILRTAGCVEDVAGALIAQALENGGRDNVSVVAVQYDGPSAAVVGEQQSASESSAMPAIGDFLRSPLALGMGGAILVFIIFWIVTRGV